MDLEKLKRQLTARPMTAAQLSKMYHKSPSAMDRAARRAEANRALYRDGERRGRPGWLYFVGADAKAKADKMIAAAPPPIRERRKAKTSKAVRS